MSVLTLCPCTPRAGSWWDRHAQPGPARMGGQPGGEHPGDVGPPERVRRDVGADRWLGSFGAELVGMPYNTGETGPVATVTSIRRTKR